MRKAYTLLSGEVGLENVYEQLKVGEMTLSMDLLWGRSWKPEVWMDLRIC